MKKTPEEPKEQETAAATPEQKATKPEAKLPTYYNLEEIKSLGPDLDNLEIGRRGMAFAAAYLGFWEMRYVFFEGIGTDLLQGKDKKQMVATAKERAMARFIKIHEFIRGMTTGSLENIGNFWGYLFQTGVTNGITLFTEWTETPEGRGEMTRATAGEVLKLLISAHEPPEELNPEA